LNVFLSDCNIEYRGRSVYIQDTFSENQNGGGIIRFVKSVMLPV
jgi:hypothetical protein